MFFFYKMGALGLAGMGEEEVIKIKLMIEVIMQIVHLRMLDVS